MQEVCGTWSVARNREDAEWSGSAWSVGRGPSQSSQSRRQRLKAWVCQLFAFGPRVSQVDVRFQVGTAADEVSEFRAGAASLDSRMAVRMIQSRFDYSVRRAASCVVALRELSADVSLAYVFAQLERNCSAAEEGVAGSTV
jgi:hypothetical protein